MSNEASRDPRRWFSHFVVSFKRPKSVPKAVWPTDVDWVLHNRRTGRVLIIEGKPMEWRPSESNGQMEALRALSSLRCQVYLLKADWPQGATGPVMDTDEAQLLAPPSTVKLSEVHNLREWKTLSWDEYADWIERWWKDGGAKP